MNVMNLFVNDLFERVAAKAALLAQHSKRSDITGEDIQTAIRLLLPPELSRNALSKGSKVASRFRKV
nr:unnamed protein product [Callosobruchus analis]